MAARFEALGDHCVHAMLFQPTRFGDGGGAAQDEGTGFLNFVEQILRRQAEMETDDLWAMTADQIQVRRTEAGEGQAGKWYLAQAVSVVEGWRRARIWAPVPLMSPGSE
jgi:hypothetical protein